MARSCCRRVYQHEEDMKVIELEETHFKTLHSDFCTQAGRFKVLAKRVYKSLNVLWYTANSMPSNDSRRNVYLDVVIKISVNWYNVDNRIRKEYHGMSLLSKKYPDTPLRQVLDEIEDRASMTEVEFNKQLLWDSKCREQLVGAFREVVARTSRLLDGDWLIRYYIFFEQANPRLEEYDERLTIFFRYWMDSTPEDFPVEIPVQRTQTKPPHEIAFSHVAQLLSSGCLDGERPEPELLDLSLKKPDDQQAVDKEMAKFQDAISNVPKGDENPRHLEITNAVAVDNILNADGNETAKSPNAKPDFPRYDEHQQSREKETAVVLDNITLAIERVVANCREDDEPECVDLTESPAKEKPPPASRRKRQAAKKEPAQEVVPESTPKGTADEQRLPAGESKSPPTLENVGTETTPKPLIVTSMISVNIPVSVSTMTVAATRQLAATPNTQGLARIPTDMDKVTLAPTLTVLRPIPRRFLNARTLITNSCTAELAANQLRLGFAGGSGETGPIALGTLFERLYRKDMPVPNQQGPDSNQHGPRSNQLVPVVNQHGPGSSLLKWAGAQQQGPSPSQQEPVVKQMGPVEKKQGPVEMKEGPVEKQVGPVVKQLGPVAKQQGPVEKQIGPMVKKQGSVEKQIWPEVKQLVPVAKQIGPIPKQQGPMAKQLGPVMKQQGPMAKQNGPSPNQQGRELNQHGPSLSQQGPSPNQHGLVAKQSKPSPNHQESGTKQKGPGPNHNGRESSQHRPGEIKHGELKSLLLQPSTNVPKADVANAGHGPVCGVKGHASKCTGHLVPVKPLPNVVKNAGESSRPFGPNFVGSGFVMQAAKRKRQVLSEQVGQGGPEKVNDANTGNSVAAKRRFVANGRQPFKEIRPKPTKTPDVDAPTTGATVQSSATNTTYIIQTDKGVHMISGDNLFKPYKLELQMNPNKAAMPKVLGMAATAPATATATSSASESTGGVVADEAMQAKTYDFRSRPKVGQEGNEEKSVDQQQLTKPTIKLRKDLFSKRDSE